MDINFRNVSSFKQIVYNILKGSNSILADSAGTARVSVLTLVDILVGALTMNYLVSVTRNSHLVHLNFFLATEILCKYFTRCYYLTPY